MRRALTVLRIVLGVVLLLYILTVTDGWQRVAGLGEAPWLLFALPAMAILGTAVEGARLRLLCRAQRIHITFGRGFQLSAIGTTYSFVMPGGTSGDVMKLYYMARENRGRVVETGLALLVDRAVALFGLLLLILALAVLNFDMVVDQALIGWLVLIAASVAVALLLFMVLSLSARLRRIWLYLLALRKLPLKGLLRRISDALYAFRDHKRELFLALAWSLFGHISLAVILTVTGSVLMPDAPSRILPFLSLLGSLANVLPITPGGLGVGEAATEHLFSLQGLSGGAALIVAWRMSTLPVCVIGAMLAMVGVKRRNQAPATSGAASPEK
jgi:uncharacterized protein (TIRG00374 family)